MVKYSIASVREDGARNYVVMSGKSGYLGYSYVYLKYLEDGWISLTGENPDHKYEQKLISKFTLEPGEYTLTGLKAQENTIDFQLSLEDDAGTFHYIYLFDNSITFFVEKIVLARLYVRVYPGVKEIRVVARPAVYRDD